MERTPNVKHSWHERGELLQVHSCHAANLDILSDETDLVLWCRVN